MLRKLAAHTSAYSLGSLLAAFSGAITFPILTRVFTVEEYGLLNLISATLTVLTGIGKLGVQNSIVRFHGEVEAGKRGPGMREFYSTAFFGMATVGLAVMLMWAGASQLIPDRFWGDERAGDLLLLTAVLILMRVLDSCLTNILRAEQRSLFLSISNVVRRYFSISVIVAVVLYVSRDLTGFYGATVATEALALIVLTAIMFRGRGYTPRAFSPTLFRSMLVFGIPMIAYELAGIVLSIGDRYVIQAVLGSAALGIYSAAYNLCEYVQVILVASLVQAIQPMMVRIWEQSGAEATRLFIQRSLRYYLMLALPVIAGMSVVGSELMVVLASEKYREAARVIPFIISGVLLDGLIVMVGAGLYLHKRTPVIAGLVAACAVFKLGLNTLLVSEWGIDGAAIGTLLCYLILTTTVFIVSGRRLRIEFPWMAAFKFGLLAAIMYGAVTPIAFEHPLPGLLVKVATGAAVYAALMLGFDREARAVALDIWRKYAPRRFAGS